MTVVFSFNPVYALRKILELMPVIGGLLTPRRLANGVAVLLFAVVMLLGSPKTPSSVEAGDVTSLFEADCNLADIHIRLGDPGFEQVVADIYRGIILRNFPPADSERYVRRGDFFASVGMRAESAESYRRAGGER